MSWFDRFQRKSNDANIPDEYANLSVEEILQGLQEGRQAAQKLSTLEGELNQTKEQYASTLSEADKIKARLAEIEARGNQNNNPKPDETKGPTDWWEDGDKAFNERINPLATIALSSGALTAKMYFESKLKPEDKEIYNKYEKEIQDYMAKEAPNMQVSPIVWDNMFKFVKGNHIDDIISERMSQRKGVFVEDGARGPMGPQTPEDIKAQEQPNDIDRKMAEIYGVKPEDVLKVKKTFKYGSPTPKEYAR